jgi:hypothetical protein|tara:strand:- start:410 stop:778 length:369 start_codon:yes stop_codon:yes gene_type:complete
MVFGKSEEYKAIEKLIKSYENRGDAKSKQMAAKLKVELAAMEDKLKQGYLDTAIGDIPQASPKASGRAQFQPQNFKNFAMSPFISDNPLSMGGATFAPVDRAVLNPEEKKRSPWWGLMGYNV